jgi:hypothetical protein
VSSGFRCSFPGGIDRAGIVTAGLEGATCFVGSGEGIGTRRSRATAAATDPWVARAGVVALARVIEPRALVFVRLLADVLGTGPLVFAFAFDFRAFLDFRGFALRATFLFALTV